MDAKELKTVLDAAEQVVLADRASALDDSLINTLDQAVKAARAALHSDAAQARMTDEQIDALAKEHRIYVTKSNETIFHSNNTLKKIRAFARDLLGTGRAYEATVPPDVMAALDRMCTPLDKSVLTGATAKADSHSMKLIRDYVLRIATPREDVPALGLHVERLEALAKHLEAGGETLIGAGMSACYAESIRAILVTDQSSTPVAPAAAAKACVCGDPATANVVHRQDGPCYVAPPDEREAFEECIRANCDPDRLDDRIARDGDYYVEYATALAWVAWQAARATAPQAINSDERAAFDVEAMLKACVPGGSICDPQTIADSLREWFAARATASQATHMERAGLFVRRSMFGPWIEVATREKGAETLYRVTALQATEHLDKRAAFEAWAKPRRYDLTRCSPEAYAAYKSDLTEGAWSGWLGRDGEQSKLRLDKPAQVGAGRFGVNVKWSTVIGAAQRHYEYMQTPEREAERIETATAFAQVVQRASMSEAACDVLAERTRQVSEEGWTPVHDDQHGDHQMSCAAGCYAMYTLAYPAGDPPPAWPWAADWWKPTTHRRNLVKAGALILAEIERIDRAGSDDEQVDAQSGSQDEELSAYVRKGDGDAV